MRLEKYSTAWQVTYDDIIWYMSFACRVTKGTDTHSEYVIHIASARQQWLREPTLLSYMYISCLVIYPR
jgi:hypothetical protein